MIQAKSGQIVIERRKESPSAPVAERTEPVRTGVTLAQLVAKWNAGSPSSDDLVIRVKKWEAVSPAGKVLGVVRAPNREMARELAGQGFEMNEPGEVLVRYVGTVVEVIRKGGRS